MCLFDIWIWSKMSYSQCKEHLLNEAVASLWDIDVLQLSQMFVQSHQYK